MKSLESQISRKDALKDIRRRDRRIDAFFFALPNTAYAIACGLGYYLGTHEFVKEAKTTFEYAALNFSTNLVGIAGAVSIAKSCFYWCKTVLP